MEEKRILDVYKEMKYKAKIYKEEQSMKEKESGKDKFNMNIQGLSIGKNKKSTKENDEMEGVVDPREKQEKDLKDASNEQMIKERENKKVPNAKDQQNDYDEDFNDDFEDLEEDIQEDLPNNLNDSQQGQGQNSNNMMYNQMGDDEGLVSSDEMYMSESLGVNFSVNSLALEEFDYVEEVEQPDASGDLNNMGGYDVDAEGE